MIERMIQQAARTHSVQAEHVIGRVWIVRHGKTVVGFVEFHPERKYDRYECVRVDDHHDHHTRVFNHAHYAIGYMR